MFSLDQVEVLQQNLSSLSPHSMRGLGGGESELKLMLFFIFIAFLEEFNLIAEKQKKGRETFCNEE